ncbi:MAG: Amylo-alpha6-glucosidase [Frankiales bacterium]|nr:Amylo-alpha6-glucosidase [Frankiales bacterium]
MTEGWAYGGAPQATAHAGTVTLIEGVTFCICGRSGDIRTGAEQGLFYRDTRFVSRLELAVDGQALEPLAVQSVTPYAGTFVLRRPPRPGTADSTLLVVRRRYVGNGLREDVTVRNLGREVAGVQLELAVDSDFAGLFEVKEGRVRERTDVQRAAEPDGLRLGRPEGDGAQAVVVRADRAPSTSPAGLQWQLVVPKHQDVTVSVHVTPVLQGAEAPARFRPGQAVETSEPAAQLAAWRRAAPAVSTPDDGLIDLLRHSATDLGMLRIFDADHPERVVVAAGAPWFMTLFGRDALLTSWMLLPLDPSVALGTLQTLADLQGVRVDPLTEEEPGRILHEVRAGLDAAAALGGGACYYGSVDATPLFVMLLGELRRWGLERAHVDALLPHADRALAWIEQHGDRDADGFVEYQRATDRGLVNQGWKDSFDAITFASGAFAEPPISLVEVQGYAYGAFLARAHFATEAGDDALARHWADRASALKQRFNEVFWLPEHGYYALALDGDKRPVDALASNMGHCLWTGIVDEDKAASVAEHLLGPQMFSGFGVRTLATNMGAYNPMSYHNGSVWPHDNALIAAGLMRYGFVEEAQTVALALLDAARHFGGRLPELFCGFDRAEFAAPVPYPTSCEPQAWSAASPLYLLRTLLRFEPWVPFGKLWCDPAVPPPLLPLRIERLRLAGTEVSLSVTADDWDLEGLPPDIELFREARQPLTAASYRG